MKSNKIYTAQLLQNICQGDDQKSFEELFKSFYEKLINFSIYYISDREAAEEIVSDIFLKLWTRRKELYAVQNLETYLFAAVKNHSLNHIKKFSHYRLVHLEETGIPKLIHTLDPEKELERKELLFKMDQAIDTLPRQCKIIFNLIKEEGLKYKEVAQILDISPRTVETQLVRAMKKLDIIFSPYINSRKSTLKSKTKAFAAINTLLFSIFV